jgi:hypothetical protein
MAQKVVGACWFRDARQDSLQLDTPTSGGPAADNQLSIVSKLLQEYAAEVLPAFAFRHFTFSKSFDSTGGSGSAPIQLKRKTPRVYLSLC